MHFAGADARWQERRATPNDDGLGNGAFTAPTHTFSFSTNERMAQTP